MRGALANGFATANATPYLWPGSERQRAERKILKFVRATEVASMALGEPEAFLPGFSHKDLRSELIHDAE
jgi:hypothetical protein